MTKELLMLYGARYAVLKMLNKGSNAFGKRLEDGTWQTIEWADICNYLTDIINNHNEEREEINNE